MEKAVKNLLLAEFSVRAVNYRPSFFPSIYGPCAKRAGHKSMEKTRIRNLQYGPKKRGQKKVYYMASSCLGDQKQVQDAQFDRHLTSVKKESFYWRTKTKADNKGFPKK